MTKQAHTPGPWAVSLDERIDEDGLYYVAGYNIVSDSGREIVGCEGIYGGENDEADAYLIAAAPELLAALQAIVSGCVQRVETSLHQQALAAVAKAKGRSLER